jgi:phage terminase large subunit-like protein
LEQLDQEQIAAYWNRAEREGWSDKIKTRADEEAVNQGCYWDQRAGDKAVYFIENFLWQTKNVKKPRKVKLFDWQKDDIIFPIFAWKKANGLRRFTQAYIEIPKKNGKSMLCSAIVLYCLMADNEPRAEVYSIAFDKENAKTIFRECAVNARANPLNKRLNVTESKCLIEYAANDSFYRVLAADQSKRNEGFEISACIIDEFHTMAKRELFDTLRYGGKTRRQPLYIYITTAGTEKNSICYQYHEHARAILDGNKKEIIDFYPYIRSGEGLDWTDEETWKIANPMLGLTIPLEAFRAEFLEAKSMPSQEATFKRYNLNIWADNKVRWLPSGYWNSCGELYDEKELLGKKCFGGIDLGWIDDLSAFVLAFPFEDGFRIKPYFWMAEENIKKKNRFNPYEIWLKEGHIIKTPGAATEFKQVANDISEICKGFKPEIIGFDSFNATGFSQELQNKGFKNLRKCGQNFRFMTEPCRLLEALILKGKIWHNQNPVLSWMAGNAVLIMDNSGNMKINKPNKNSADKVDGIVSLLMALGVSLEPKKSQPFIQTF